MVRIHLSKLLGEKRMKQSELSRLTGIGKNVINAIYNEFVDRISLEHIDRICEVLDCDISDLIEYVPNKIPKTGHDVIVEKRENRKIAKKKKENA